jgi:alkylation response protein AidB-like acyl-CoA dehydrogenase
VGNFYKDNDDLRFYMEKWIDWEPLVELTEYLKRAKDGFKSTGEAVEFYTDIVDLIGQFVADEIAPHTEEIDRQGVDFVDGEAVLPARQTHIFEQLKALELHGMCLPRELGGQNCPLLVYQVGNEIFSRADVSVAAHHGFHGGIAMASLVFSIREGTTEYDVETAQITKTRFADAIEEIRRGDAWGCMDITEPDAGSDMAKLRCLGEQDDDGNWTVTGQKIFITSGHGKYHYVIARTEKVSDGDDPFAGLKGLSFFMVPAYTEDADGKRTRIVTIDRLEEKLGHHGSATCALTFEQAPAHLIGKRGEGFQYMLTLMNNARVGVGFESLGLCEAAYRLAKEYAAERRSMGKTIDRHEMIADYLDEMEVDIVAIRALAMHGGFHEEVAQKIGLMETTGVLNNMAAAEPRVEHYRSQYKMHKAKARRVTPLLKYLASEKAVDMARQCVQIHGGVGYTKDYGAEKLLRDAMVMPIYEGTSQIQALMAMKDTLGGLLKNPQRFVRRMAQARWRSMSARDPLERRVTKLQVLSLSAQQALILRTAKDKYKALQGKPLSDWPASFFKEWDPKRDFAFAMLHAERLIQILIDESVCEVLYEQARKHPERRHLLERYLERAEPRCRYLLDQITTTGDRLLESLSEPEQFAESVAS